MIIDATDFVNRPYKVPNQEESRDFISFLESEEQAFAKCHDEEKFALLGVDVWNEFDAALSGSGTLDAKWERLRDGATYTHNSKTYEYKGWVDMVRPGLLARWAPLSTYKLTNVGFVENNASSAPQAGNQAKLIEDQYPFIVKYWNEFIAKVGYKAGSWYNCENSFYGFMKANQSDYANWNFKCPRLKNRHDI